MTEAAEKRISRDDLEARFRRIKSETDMRKLSAKERLMPFVIGAGVLVLVLAYLSGRRVGRKKSTVVEIRRV